MIDNLKLKYFKGIKDIELNGLKKVNVVCGKNNSGKSSILEAASNSKYSSVGILVDKEKFEPYITRYVNATFPYQPNHLFIQQRQAASQAIMDFFSKYVINHPLWYAIDKLEIQEAFRNNHRLEVFLNSWEPEVFMYDEAIKNYLEQNDINYTPILIPPKRQLHAKQSLNGKDEFNPNGNGIINKLFFLKNQGINSKDHSTFQKILTSFKKITNTSFNITINSEHGLNLNFLIDGNWLAAENCGLGLSDILIIVTITLATKENFILIEEPESHLHADFQKRLLSFINSVPGKQFLISTHSNVFLDINNVDKIYYSWFDGEIKVSDETTPSKIISSLGYSITENLTSDAIILTEGPKDVPIIQKLLKLVGVLDKYNVKFWLLGGDIMAEIDLSVFSDRQNVFAIIDDDPGSKKVRKAFKDNCKEQNIHCYALERYAIENYLTLEAIRKVFGDTVDSTIILKHDTSVDEQIGFKAKSKSIKAKNYQIIDHMDIKDFESTDLLQFIHDIKDKLEKHFAPKENSIVE